MLESKVSDLSANLEEIFIKPTLEGYHQVIVMEHLTSNRSSLQPPVAVLGHLSTIVTYLSTTLPQPVLSILKPKLCPSLADKLVENFLSIHIPLALSDLAIFDTLLDTVNIYDKQLTKFGWTHGSGTVLAKWVSNAPKVWFATRRADFLLKTVQFVLHKLADRKNIIISNGIDITTESQPIVQLSEPIQGAKQQLNATEDGDDGEETDAWGFDTQEEETEDVIGDTEADSWNWDEENDDAELPLSRDNGSFPYALSSIPDGLLEIVERMLSEGSDLQSPRFGFELFV